MAIQEDEAKRKEAADEKRDGNNEGGIRLGRLKKAGTDGKSSKGGLVFGEVRRGISILTAISIR